MFANVIILILTWEYYPTLSRGALSMIICILAKGSQENFTDRKDGAMWPWRQRLSVGLPAKECQRSPKAGRRRTDYSLEPPERLRSCQHIDFHPVKLLCDSGFPNCEKTNVCYLKPPSWWWFIIEQQETKEVSILFLEKNSSRAIVL